MAGRSIPLVTGEYYHVYNRGVGKQPTFLSRWDYEQMMLTIPYYQLPDPPVKLSRFKELPQEQRMSFLGKHEREKEKLVEIVSFVLMPNHFHLLLHQTKDNGISIFISLITNSFTRYFNTKHKRVGPIFQGVFKAVHVETDEQLLHLSRYIHLNPLVSFVVKEENFLSYPWSSFPDYLKGKSSLVTIKSVLSHFSTSQKYQEFVLDQADYGKKLERIKHLTLEN